MANFTPELQVPATVIPLDERTVFVASGIETVDGSPLTDNVLRRACTAVGRGACFKTCQLAALEGRAPADAIDQQTADLVAAEDATTSRIEEDPKVCADRNLAGFLEGVGVPAEQALTVGVTATIGNERVGFLDDPETRDRITSNPHGWQEVAGYNAFFARVGDTPPGTDKPLRALINRMADSGHVVATMKDRQGDEVIGLFHSTRTNMHGEEHLEEYGGERRTFIESGLLEAMERFGVEPADVNLHVTAAVGAESWRKRYPNWDKLNDKLRGWTEMGLVYNRTLERLHRPGEQTHEPDNPEQLYELWPLYTDMVSWQVRHAAQRLGIESDNVIIENPLNPGQPRNGIIHSSANRERVLTGVAGDTRDAYAVILNL